jgi:hypothetical protein
MCTVIPAFTLALLPVLSAWLAMPRMCCMLSPWCTRPVLMSPPAVRLPFWVMA